MRCVGVKSRCHRSMPAGPGSADRLQVSWSAVSSVHSARSVGDLCQCGPGTAAGPRQSLLTSQRRVTRRLCHVRRRVLLQVSDLAAGHSRTARVRQLWYRHGSVSHTTCSHDTHCELMRHPDIICFFSVFDRPTHLQQFRLMFTLFY